jgi:hypothetical protein
MRAEALGLAVALAACGSTTIRTNRPDATIYVDGEPLGEGEVAIDQTGTSRTARIEVRAPDGRVGYRTIERSITGTTVVTCIFTYGVCCFLCQQYPDEVEIVLAEGPPPGEGGGGWDDGGSAWDRPPAGAPTPAPAAPSAPGAPPAAAPPPAPAPADDPWQRAPTPTPTP